MVKLNYYTKDWITVFIMGIIPSYLLGYQGIGLWAEICFVGWVCSWYNFNIKK